VRRVGQVTKASPGVRALLFVAVISLPALPALPTLPAFVSGQASFGDTRDLKSTNPSTRLRAVQRLQETALAESALPLAPLINDPQDEVQFAAIAAELNIFLADRILPRRRVGLVIEKRSSIAAETAFTGGRFSLGVRSVPAEVLAALRKAAHDENARVALEAVYAFGLLALQPSGSARRVLLRATWPDIAPLVGASDPAMRYAAARVLSAVFARRPGDEPIDEPIGDALITALNDDDRVIKAAAMQALGAIRYDRAVQALTDLYAFYGQGQNEMAEAALDALAHIAQPASGDLFTTALSARSAALRVSAIEGLARIGDATKLAAIVAAVDADRSEATALAGVYASARLANGRIDRIGDALAKPRLRAQARQYLIELLPGRAAALTSHAQDPDARVRLEAIELLGASGDRAAVPLVERALRDREPQVARAAERALVRLRAQ